MTVDLDLPPDLRRFAEECVASGRFASVSEVVRASLRLLQETETRRRRFDQMLAETRDEAEREGWLAIEEVLGEVDAVIEEAERRRG